MSDGHSKGAGGTGVGAGRVLRRSPALPGRRPAGVARIATLARRLTALHRRARIQYAAGREEGCLDTQPGADRAKGGKW